MLLVMENWVASWKGSRLSTGIELATSKETAAQRTEQTKEVNMVRQILASAFFMLMITPFAIGDDVLRYEEFYNYDTGFYDTKAVLYDTDNDWYYDYYIVGPQEEVDLEYEPIEDEYDWEVKDQDIF